MVFGFLRVFPWDQPATPAQFRECLKRYRLAEVKSLQLGAADLPQETYLLHGFHAFTYGVHTEGSCHPHQLDKNVFSGFALVQLPHEAHIKFDQIKRDALKHVQR